MQLYARSARSSPCGTLASMWRCAAPQTRHAACDARTPTNNARLYRLGRHAQASIRRETLCTRHVPDTVSAEAPGEQ